MEIGKSMVIPTQMQTERTNDQQPVERKRNLSQDAPGLSVGKDEEISGDTIKRMVDGLNSFLKPTFTSIRYEYHEKLDRYYVTVVDKDTEETIKEVPPKKLLDVYASMAELAGLIVDKKI